MAKSILVVDDNADDLNSMCEVLEKEGYDVHCETDSKSALEIIGQKTFNLMLVDIMMPEISGYELVKIAAKKLPKNTKKAYVSIVPKKEADLSYVDGFIQKPFEIESFLNDVKKLIEA